MTDFGRADDSAAIGGDDGLHERETEAVPGLVARRVRPPDALEDEFVESRKRSRNESSIKRSKRSLVSRFNK